MKMNEKLEKVADSGAQSWSQAAEMIDKLFMVARPEAVFSAPVTAGEHTVITAAEVTVAMGAGGGGGFGYGPPARKPGEAEPAGDQAEASSGGGSGGGGGGAAAGRPVAAIIVGPDGVWVEPIMDPTKIALAFFTTLASMAFMLGRIWKAGRR
jgi:uncharacterized spore protein YtfJ